MTTRAKVRAPELTGDRWLNTGGRTVSLAELRGKIVLLDFWTSGCINCLHVLDELRPLETEYADVLVTIGVHSPKFLHEGEADAIAAAVERYEVHHPVLNDPDLATWTQYAVKAWPTLVLIDPEGYVVHVAAGEGHGEALRRVVAELVQTHQAKGTLRRGGSVYVEPGRERTALRFPSKAVELPNGNLLVADTAGHDVVELAGDAETVVRRFGTGKRGADDGPPDRASFAEPSGIAVLPTEIATRVGYDVVVADTAGHLLRGIDLTSGEVSTVAGTGAQWRDGADSGPAREVDLTSPWDVVWWDGARSDTAGSDTAGSDGAVVIAMAGNHTLGTFDPIGAVVRRLAGTTVEGLRDGPASDAFFAQTSGFAADGDTLWFVDAETSALRRLRMDRSAGYVVDTVVGTDLFSFGHKDGPAAEALLQHPLGVAVLADGTVAVADTYNGAIRGYHPATGEIGTLAEDLAEPSGLLVRGDLASGGLASGGDVLIVESAAHRLTSLSGSASATVDGDAHAVRRPPSILAPGELAFEVVFTPPPGQKLDDRYGPSTRLEVSASPPELLLDGDGAGTDLRRSLRLNGAVREGVLQVVAQAASCDVDAEHPVCRMSRQDWGVPVRLDGDGESRLTLVMAGLGD